MKFLVKAVFLPFFLVMLFIVTLSSVAFAQTSPSADPVTSCKPVGKPPNGKDGLPCKDLKNPVFGICTAGVCKATSYTDQGGKSQNIADLNALAQLLKGALDQLKQQTPSPAPTSPTPSPYPYPGGCGNSLGVQKSGSQMVVCPDPSRICSLIRLDVPHMVARGASGDDVTTLQKFLKEQGQFNQTPTGFFGPLTQSALAQFQLQNGIIKNFADGGILGPLTRKFIGNKWCQPTPSDTDPASDSNCKQWRGCGGPTCSRSAPGATPQCGTDISQEVCTSAPVVCREYFSTPTPGGSCVAYGHTFSNGHVERNAFCSIYFQQSCNSAVMMFPPWTCTNGQWCGQLGDCVASLY
ncbi:MAG: peptidoglycan-binding domain-containing protein [bacterium]|nr:peptidoglycan-binding domain-containing protein [bacterium]